MTNPVVVVVGAGPGLGRAVAHRWAREGYDVALLGRRPETVTALGEELQAAGVTTGWSACDITDPVALTAAVTRFGEFHDSIDVLHFNPSVFRRADPLHLSAADLLEDVALGVAALLTAAQAALPFLHQGGRVTATGSMAADAPWHEAASLGVQKAGLRNLVRSLDATLRPRGVRAMSLTVNGTLAEGTGFSPERVADALVTAAKRPDDDAWTDEVLYDG
jgi:NAD(P)-dependent dehydrogenase (short-subunit alcohol dehydrogenase family)